MARGILLAASSRMLRAHAFSPTSCTFQRLFVQTSHFLCRTDLLCKAPERRGNKRPQSWPSQRARESSKRPAARHARALLGHATRPSEKEVGEDSFPEVRSASPRSPLATIVRPAGESLAGAGIPSRPPMLNVLFSASSAPLREFFFLNFGFYAER